MAMESKANGLSTHQTLAPHSGSIRSAVGTREQAVAMLAAWHTEEQQGAGVAYQFFRPKSVAKAWAKVN